MWPGAPESLLLTIARIEKGMPSRIATRRKILLGLGLKLNLSEKAFGTPTLWVAAN